MAITVVPDTVLGAGPATTTFETLLEEFYARGFDYLNQDDTGRLRAQRWINQAYLGLCDAERWPFLFATAYSTAPFELPDLGEIREVWDLTDDSRLVTMDEFLLTRAQREDEGTPCHFYLEDLTIHIAPPNAEHDLAVKYKRIPSPLEEDGHVALVPNRFIDIIIDGAAIKGLKDSDNWETVQAALSVYDRQVEQMRIALLARQPGQETIIANPWSDW